IIATTAALYTIFFYLSFSVTLPHFTLLYLPIVLLGVFPIWFGWSGLAGAMIGAFIIYLINWILMPKMAAEDGKRKSLFALCGVYAFSLFVGVGYILWQYT